MVQSEATMPPSTRSTVPRRAAASRAAHRLEQVAGLVADALERGAGELGRGRCRGSGR